MSGQFSEDEGDENGKGEPTMTALADAVSRCETIMAHAWMVRTFIKHSDEVEDFPELMGIVRAVFDTARALETRIDDPVGYLRMLRKKISKLRKATDEFRGHAPIASTHTNFRQAVISIDSCVEQLQAVLDGCEAELR